MEEPTLFVNTPINENKEQNLINKEIIINQETFNFTINIINDDEIKFILLNKDNISFIEYIKELSFENFRKVNKYFKMFDTLNEIGKELISIINENNLDIINESKDIFLMKLKLFSKTDNIVNIYLEKHEIKNEEKMNKILDLFKEFKNNLQIKDKKIEQLESEISLINKNNENFKKNMLEELNKKEQQIISLENNINELKNGKKYNNFEKIQKSEDTNYHKVNNCFENILKNSSIFQDIDEILFLLRNIFNGHNISQMNMKLLYNSKIEGENEENLINSYVNKNDIIILIKTDKLRRFGGFAHESFEADKFRKTDKNAFLFNLNKKTIYKSKGNERSIWRGFNTNDSINFGNGVDLKIFHNFTKNKCKTFQGNYDYDYKNENYALNGDESFNISSLEIYQTFLIINN